MIHCVFWTSPVRQQVMLKFAIVDLSHQLFADLLRLAFLRNTAIILAISAYFPHLLHLDAIAEVLGKAVGAVRASEAKLMVPNLKWLEDNPVARTAGETGYVP